MAEIKAKVRYYYEESIEEVLTRYRRLPLAAFYNTYYGTDLSLPGVAEGTSSQLLQTQLLSVWN